ncbi:ABC transporter ATP-binding protein [Paenibacillus glacialis]|uniref:ABC transporter n=1 Tax=Paenibacillus glacialis TaxID=494026 RepID=A0A168ML86_9BACL|nr:ABC transporter ATP-binding protein [Paenibacillus glacialis]OAB44805.1 hypothetical protein PGLA_05175 [Paenibacillus glacialis]
MIKNYQFLKVYLKNIKLEIIIIILLGLIVASIEIYMPLLIQQIVDKGVLKKDFNYVAIISLYLALLYVFNALVSASLNILFSKTSIKVVTNIKKDIFTRVLRFPVSFFDKNKTGYVISRIDEIDTLNSLFSPIFMNFLKSVFVFVGVFIIVLKIKWELLLIALLFMPLFYLITKKTSKEINSSSRELNEFTAEATGEFHESISALIEVKSFKLENKKESRIKEYISLLSNKILQRNIVSVIGNESIVVLVMLSKCIFIMLIGYYIIEGELTVGSYFSLLAYVSSLFIPIQMLSSINLSIQPAVAVLSRLNFFLDAVTEDEMKGTHSMNEIHEIKFENVTFIYPNSKKYVFQNINFSLNTKKNLYIYGPNGSGKTTIIKLLLGFYNSYDGKIMLNEHDIRDIDLSSLRREIGVVSQKIQLFSGSLIDNITLWDEEITKEELVHILDGYGLSNIITENKYDNISELGKNLSGGQIQEIALARVIFKNPSLFIFDEPTSNLDYQNKLKFIEILHKLENKMCIIITHDDFLISNLDRERNMILDITNLERKLVYS